MEALSPINGEFAELFDTLHARVLEHTSSEEEFVFHAQAMGAVRHPGRSRPALQRTEVLSA